MDLIIVDRTYTGPPTSMQPPADVGPIRRRKRSSFSKLPTKVPNKSVKTIPEVLQLCKCADCLLYPGTHPVTGLPLEQGKFLAKVEYKAHQKREIQRGTAMLRLGDNLTPPQWSPYNSTPQQPSTAQPSPSTSTSADPPSNLSYPRAPPISPSTRSILAELQRYKEALRPVEDVIDGKTLVFSSPPTAFSEPLSDVDSGSINDACKLDSSVPSNSEFLRYEKLVAQILDVCAEHRSKRSDNIYVRLRLTVLERLLEERSLSILQLKKAQWERQRVLAVEKQTFVDSAIYYAQPLLAYSPIVLGFYLLVATIHLLCGLSIDHCTFILDGLGLVMQIIHQTSPNTIAPASVFRDIRTVVSVLNLKPRTEAYVCCPSCFSIYWVDPNNPKDYPDTCINQEVDNEPCGAKLRKNRKHRNGFIDGPVREYCYQSIKDWIGRLYARQDLHVHLCRDPDLKSRPGDGTWDIWDAPGLQTFVGPDGKTPFLKGGDEGRLVFSLNMDSFNPYGNKEAGKKISMGAIYMVCLNLPPAIRYNPENMYLVAVIPGPHEPSAHQINYLLRPLVDDLLIFWETGVYYTRVHGFPNGKLVRCAVVPLVCDLPAARQMSGSAHFRSKHFCSFCKQKRDDINNLEYDKWIPRSLEEHRLAAKGWLKAKTLAEREKWYSDYGVRWSELLRLPYWDPIKFTVIDSMHAFYLRLFSRHCRDIWGMDVKFEDGDGITFDLDPKHPTEVEMQQAHEVLEHGSRNQLNQLRRAILRQLCMDTTTLDWRGRKGLLVDRLIQYRVRQGWFTESGGALNKNPTRHAEKKPADATATTVAQTTTAPFDVEDTFRTATKTYIYKLKKANLIAILTSELSTYTASAAELEKCTNLELRAKVQRLRTTAGVIDDHEKVIGRNNKGTRVLGRNTLAEIRKDMDIIQLPSWVSPAPAHPGEKKWGKFSADQWRTFCTVNLPITLIRLWGSKPEDSREHRMLVNFLHLVSAVKLATRREITEEQITEYEYHMHQYLDSLLKLYDNTSITPYQHLSLHFGPLLRRWGPTHAWRCFPFERYNYLMQKVPTNGHLGEMAKTLFHRFTMAQNIRNVFHIDNLPAPLRPLVSIFDRTFKSDIRGTLINDLLAFDDSFQTLEEKVTWTPGETSKLRIPVYQLLRSWVEAREPEMVDEPITSQAYHRTYIRRLGQKFHTSATSPADSNIMFKRNGEELCAGRISEIFSHTRRRPNASRDPVEITKTFVVIKPYADLRWDKISEDHYRDFPVLGGRSFRDQRMQEILLSIDDVHCHFVRYPDDINGVFLALPMDR